MNDPRYRVNTAAFLVKRMMRILFEWMVRHADGDNALHFDIEAFVAEHDVHRDSVTRTLREMAQAGLIARQKGSNWRLIYLNPGMVHDRSVRPKHLEELVDAFEYARERTLRELDGRNAEFGFAVRRVRPLAGDGQDMDTPQRRYQNACDAEAETA